MALVKGLKCRECGRPFENAPIHVCEYCFGPLEITYDYDEIKRRISREVIASRPPNMWRYRELLPIDGDPTVGQEVGFTPLFRADRLGKALGLKNLYIKNDAVNHPTLSFKDRVVGVALSKAKEFGFTTVACASTGNLANSVAANAARAGLEAYVFMPADLEQGKIIGTRIYGAHLIGISGNYDDVNRLCSEIAGKYGWAFVNINIRPYYAEGSKSFGYELVEQMGWKLPDEIVVPMAGGSLITKIHKSFEEMIRVGLIRGPVGTRFHGAQGSGCAPIVAAVKARMDFFKPVKDPKTVAKSLAIGNPADGYYAIRQIRSSGGWAEDPTDEEIVEGMKLLARTEGVFTETAGGVTIGALKRLAAEHRIDPDATVVACITGNGLKTLEAITAHSRVMEYPVIPAKLEAFDAYFASSRAA
ncbi:threonine synthase [bacterium]|nr:threonine synthase [bacterium]